MATVDVWLNWPPILLTTKEMDWVYERQYRRQPHPVYGAANIPAYQMIRFSIAIQRGCFGGCTFCSITEHEGRIIQSRSEDSIIKEVEAVRDTVPGFTGVISDLGGPTANMYRLACKTREIESACRRPSCVFPGICPNLNTDHFAADQTVSPCASNCRALWAEGADRLRVSAMTLASEVTREYVKELAQQPCRRLPEDRTRSDRRWPSVKDDEAGSGARTTSSRNSSTAFRRKPVRNSISSLTSSPRIPGNLGYGHMLELALWLKTNGFRADQVQAFLPSPMASATAMYHSGKNPLHRVSQSDRRGSADPEGV